MKKIAKGRQHPPTSKPFSHSKKYDPCRHPLDFYVLYTSGQSMKQIAETFQIEPNRLTHRWLRKPEMDYSFRCAQAVKDQPNARLDVLQGVTTHLPKNLRIAWRKLLRLRKSRNWEALNAVTAPLTEKEQQALYAFAFASEKGNFVHARACKFTGFSRHTITRWEQTCPDFVQTLKLLHEQLKDFWQSQLMNLGRAGNSLIILHANRTLNRDRGYGDVIDLKHSGTIQHEHAFPMRQVMDKLSPEALTEVLTAIRELKGAEQPTNGHALPAGPVHELVAVGDNREET